MSDHKINSSNEAIALKRSSFLFKSTCEDDEDLKKTVANFLKLQQVNDVSITWQRLSTGYRIVDFEIDRIKETLDFLKTHYFCANETCASSFNIDARIINKYQAFVLDVISDRNSFCALEDGTRKLIGLVLSSVKNDALDGVADEGMEQTDDLFDVLKYERDLLNEADINESYNVEKYFCIHTICVRPDFHNRGIGTALVRACLTKARKIGYSVCVGIFPAGPSQTIARTLNFEDLAVMPWINIEPSESDTHLTVTSSTITENKFVSCMGINIS